MRRGGGLCSGCPGWDHLHVHFLFWSMVPFLYSVKFTVLTCVFIYLLYYLFYSAGIPRLFLLASVLPPVAALNMWHVWITMHHPLSTNIGWNQLYTGLVNGHVTGSVCAFVTVKVIDSTESRCFQRWAVTSQLDPGTQSVCAQTLWAVQQRRCNRWT